MSCPIVQGLGLDDPENSPATRRGASELMNLLRAEFKALASVDGSRTRSSTG